jgi:hypothetical protein
MVLGAWCLALVIIFSAQNSGDERDATKVLKKQLSDERRVKRSVSLFR